MSRFADIRLWAEERELYKKGDPKSQYIKLMEEAGELADAILKENKEDQIDAVGDMIVVLTNLSHMLGFTVEYAIEEAWQQIKNRKGSMKNGTFTKNQ